jgi:hypothetical protein
MWYFSWSQDIVKELLKKKDIVKEKLLSRKKYLMVGLSFLLFIL